MKGLDVSWVATLLAPQEFAPHPNFRAHKPLSAQATLAAHLVPWRKYNWFSDIEESKISRACIASMTTGTVEDGADELSRIARSNLRSDLALSATSALLAAVAYSELDMHDRAIALLTLIISQVRTHATSADLIIVLAVLLQQRSLRRYEIGDSNPEDASEAAQLLDLLVVTDITGVESASNRPLSSTEIWSHICEALKDAARSTLLALREGAFSANPPGPTELLLRESWNRSSGYREYTEFVFERIADTQTHHLGGAPDRGDSSLSTGLMFTELLGHPIARTRRVELGVLRFILSTDDDNPAMTVEALRLFRQGRDVQKLISVLRRIRSHGPLTALRDSALQVLRARLTPNRLGGAELVLLEAAAELLTPDEAWGGLDSVLYCVDHPFKIADGSWQAESSRLESVWLAATALAHVAGRVDDVAARLCTEVSRHGMSGDQLLDRLYGRVAESLDWEQVAATTVTRWRLWAGEGPSREWPALSSVLSLNLGWQRLKDRSVSEMEMTLVTLTDHLNSVMRGAEKPDAAIIAPGRRLVASRLEKIRRDAREGMFEGGGISVADVGVGLAIYAGVKELWTPLVEFFADSHVSRSDKSGALERLARESARVPPYVGSALAQHIENLFSMSDGGMLFDGPVIDPYPNALRAVAALEVIADDELLTSCMRLAQFPDAAGRIEAARTLTTIAGVARPPSWLPILALQCSRDLDAGVRAESARCLALLLPKRLPQDQLITDRLMDLLGEDGILIPLLILRGLTEVHARLYLNRVSKLLVRNLAEQHLARGVRLQAAAVLND